MTNLGNIRKENRLLALLTGSHTAAELLEVLEAQTGTPAAIFVTGCLLYCGPAFELLSCAQRARVIAEAERLDSRFNANKETKAYGDKPALHVSFYSGTGRSKSSAILCRAGKEAPSKAEASLFQLGAKVLTELIRHAPEHDVRSELSVGFLLAELKEGRGPSDIDAITPLLPSWLKEPATLSLYLIEKDGGSSFDKLDTNGLREQILATFSKVVLVPDDYTILMLLGEDVSQSEEKLLPLLHTYHLKAVRAASLSSLMDFHNIYEETRELFSIHRYFYPELRLSSFESLKIQYLLDHANHKTELAAHVLPEIQALKKADRRDGSELFKTFGVFLWNGAQMKRSAEALHIHRNTLSYRLGCIEKMLDKKLEDLTHSDYSAYMLSIFILHYLTFKKGNTWLKTQN